MTPFEFLLPYSLDEALSLLDPEDPNIRPVGGGTAVMLMMKAGVLHPTRLISLHKIGDEHASIAVNAAGELELGGLARLADIERHAAVLEGWPMLSLALRGVANARVRAVATIGGNLRHADPHLDMPPVLAALGARVVITGPQGSRTVNAEDLCTGYYETVVARDELITRVIVPAQAGPGHYLKLTTRAAHDWPALGLAVVLKMQQDRVQKVHIFTGAATDRPTRLARAQAVIEQRGLEADALRAAAEAAATEVPLMADAHGSAEYKTQLLKTALPRAIHIALRRSRSPA
ncbi:FAD binding domain-containing protein [Hydrogenophaga sp. BPS33]|uniref:FAD binding domain-containing protein n=1 Tax=Hydrogenophaga sp. BPS33 TaxID=2651974 RepID=UPI001320270D|nr:FAD binding domain-containing protein [Hydrogenophaga sp. BPS33]QHE85748.1 xanthine dehydrogenase family protein subunit M [Hydrogenophaga sp. BPS33]